MEPLSLFPSLSKWSQAKQCKTLQYSSRLEYRSVLSSSHDKGNLKWIKWISQGMLNSLSWLDFSFCGLSVVSWHININKWQQTSLPMARSKLLIRDLKWWAKKRPTILVFALRQDH